MFSLNDSPLSTIVNTIDEDRFTVTDGGYSYAESYVINEDATGYQVRVQATEGDPDTLSICTEGTDVDDWGDLPTDPAAAVAEIARTFTALQEA